MSDSSSYALGYADIEHDRLLRQARRIEAITERFLRAAGLGEGLRVLDLGSGLGDVALLAARIVGPSGKVVGIERDERSVERARARAAEARLSNLSFVQSDLRRIAESGPYDALIGRFILQFLPDPVVALQSTAQLIRPDGIVAFQEVAWAPSRAANRGLPLWSACASAAHDAIVRAGGNTDIGLALHAIFVDAGLPAPQMTVDMPMKATREHVLWAHDLLLSVRRGPQWDAASVSVLGDLESLADRLMTEVADAKASVASVAVIGASSHRPPTR